MQRPDEMAVFVSVVREGGFSAAAKALQLTPSAISKQISRLEDRLNVRLLNRTTRQLSMTDEGEIYFQRARSSPISKRRKHLCRIAVDRREGPYA